VPAAAATDAAATPPAPRIAAARTPHALRGEGGAAQAVRVTARFARQPDAGVDRDRAAGVHDDRVEIALQQLGDQLDERRDPDQDSISAARSAGGVTRNATSL
jgi:hypothetical protein